MQIMLGVSVSAMASETTITHPEKEICLGESVTLTAQTSGDTYLWTPGGNTSKSITVQPTADVKYTCKVTKKGGSVDTGNLITLGGFEFQPSQVDNNKSAQNRLGDWINYEYLNFDRSGIDIAQGATTTATNANNVKTAYFSQLMPHGGNYMLVCDGSSSPDARVWSARNLKLKGGEKYQFKCWAANIDLEYAKHGATSLPKLKFVIENETGTSTLLEFKASETLAKWQEYTAEYTPSKDLGWCHIYIINYTTYFEGNDFALDDVYFGTVIQQDDEITNEEFPIKVNNCGDERTIHACYGMPLTVSAQNEGVSYKWNYEGKQGSIDRILEIEAADAIDLVCEVTKQGGAIITETIHVIADVYTGKDVVNKYSLCAGTGPIALVDTMACTPENFKTNPEKYFFNPTFSVTKNGSVFLTDITMDFPYVTIPNVYANQQIEGVDSYVMAIKNGECKSLGTFVLESIQCTDTIAFEYITCQSEEPYKISAKTDGNSYNWNTGSEDREIGVDVSNPGTEVYICKVERIVESHNVTVIAQKEVTIEDSVSVGKSYSKCGFTVLEEETKKAGIVIKTNRDKSIESGCDSTTALKLTVYDVAEVTPMAYFSPNGDGINDLWLIENIELYPDAIVQIFDRYNKLLFSVKSSDFTGWDGNYNGHQMPMTDYWYVILIGNEDKKLSGHFTLKR